MVCAPVVVTENGMLNAEKLALGAATRPPIWTPPMFLGSAAQLALLSGEELMKELNGDGAFTDR